MEKRKEKIVKKRGNAFGFFFFKMLVKLLGIRAAYSFLYVVCLYYILFDRQAVNKALPYIRRRFPNSGKFSAVLHVYKLFVSQGRQLIDRYVYIYNSDFFKFELKYDSDLKKFVKNSKTGLILLNSHVGNWQISLGILKYLNIKKIHILIRAEENEAVEKAINLKKESTTVNYIFADKNFGGILEIYNALKAGEVVSMMGDRSYGSKTFAVPFLNEEAHFPISSFHTAVNSNTPIALLYVVKEDIRNYTVYIDKVLYPDNYKELSKKSARFEMLKEYAKELEKFTEKYPYQFFIFDDLWKE